VLNAKLFWLLINSLTAETVDLEVDVSCIDQFSRVGLKYPSYPVVICGYHVYCTVLVLLTAKYELFL
jgi:hypothetical protein